MPTYDEIRAALNLSHKEVAQLLDLNPRTSKRWTSGFSPIPTAIRYLLLLMIALRIGPEELSKLINEPVTGRRSKKAANRAVSTQDEK